MVLLNKTMMCGGLVVLAPGSPLQVLFAILVMLLHLLFVLKLAPYVKDSEDWSAFFSTLGLCLMSLGAYSMMLDIDAQQMDIIGLVTTMLPLVCIAVVVGIMIFVDGGLWNKIQERKKNKTTDKIKQTTAGTSSLAKVTKVTPTSNLAIKQNDGQRKRKDGIKNWKVVKN